MSTLEVTKRQSRVGRRLLYLLAEHAPAVAIALCFLLPLTIGVLTAFMTQHQAGTGSLWPSPWEFGNFRKVFTAMPFGRDLLNTMLYAGLSTVGVVVSSVPVAYALARLRWRGREGVFLVVLAAMMIPAQVTSLPLYVMYAHIGWVGTLKPLIVPTFFGDAFSIFLLRQFFLTIPDEFTEAARVDGAGELRILWRVLIPMAKPAIAAVGLFAFLYAWNDFYNPLLYTGNSDTGQTLAVALSQLAKNGHQNAYELQMAASLMFLLPVLVLFFLAQKVFVEGIALTGVKG
ncbi:carbohydrate ABC transporter permease [Streptomyces fulvoviolaceus]|uniref:carbohydrate ABC transporter permease n=1 Tax=Streptomyces fulvoviolaceus TaxID=285535 RepID=UPI0006939AAC|nr:carbohydrate ABC transporter permease [Streptomyces fulvoviolaceus]MCT9075635.1 carbohydrate ABC transporter permease [Streptomyces fulvoviolaceus]